MNEAEILQRLETRRYNPDYIPPPDLKTLTIRNKLVGSLGNFVCFSGLPKTGKSTYMSALIGSAITPSDFFQIKLNLPEGRKKLCYLDTESSVFDNYRQMERIKRLTTYQRLPPMFDSFLLREDGHQMIKGYIEEYLKATPQCSVLIIDGLLDLIINYNDETECRGVIQFLKSITARYNILVITVLHLGKKDKETLGHLGSASDRYAQSTLLIEKNKELQSFNLSSKFMRSDLDFEPVSIKNFNGNWMEVDFEEEKPQYTRSKK